MCSSRVHGAGSMGMVRYIHGVRVRVHGVNMSADVESIHIRHLLFFFRTRTGLASHYGKNTSMIKPAARSRLSLLPQSFASLLIVDGGAA